MRENVFLFVLDWPNMADVISDRSSTNGGLKEEIGNLRIYPCG